MLFRSRSTANAWGGIACVSLLFSARQLEHGGGMRVCLCCLAQQLEPIPSVVQAAKVTTTTDADQTAAALDTAALDTAALDTADTADQTAAALDTADHCST